MSNITPSAVFVLTLALVGSVALSAAQAALLVSLGLQRSSADEAAAALGLPVQQCLALFSKASRRLHAHLRALAAAAQFEQQSGLDRLLPIDPRPGTVPADS